MMSFVLRVLTAIVATALTHEEGVALVQLRAKQQEPPGDGGAAGNIPELTSDYGLSYVNWTLCDVAYHSNLGGAGPDGGEQALRYYNVTTAGGQTVDLVVTTVGNYPTNNASINGLVGVTSCFGVINLASSSDSESSVMLNFDLYYHNTNTSVAFNRMYFTVFDLDEGKSAKESITFYDRVNWVYRRPDTELEISGELAEGLVFTSTQPGNGSDNPTDPATLTEQQKRRAVTVDYKSKNQWKLRFSAAGGRDGRNFVFGGKSNLVGERAPISGPTVSLRITIGGVDYVALVASDALTAAFEAAIRSAINSALGGLLTAQDILLWLSPGSVNVDATIAIPTNVCIADVVAALQSAVDDGSLASLLEQQLQQVNGLDLISSGSITATVGRPVVTSDVVGNCSVAEDPHIRVFDGKQISLLSLGGVAQEDTTRRLLHEVGAGDMWLVRSPAVKIQARYAAIGEQSLEKMYVQAIAVGGPFLNDSTIVVGPMDGMVSWNGAEILQSQTSSFRVEGLISAERHLSSHLVQDMSHSNPGIDLSLPSGVHITVNRQKSYVNLFIQMQRQGTGQDGLCGNFNGNADDDSLDLIVTKRNPRVSLEDSLFEMEFKKRDANVRFK